MPAMLENQGTVKWAEQRIPVVSQSDVLVCGGGMAGIGAATAAARNGTDVLLLDQNAFLGGTSTAAGMAQWGNSAMMMTGIVAELADRLVRAGAAYLGRVIPIDSEGLKDVAYAMVSESGARILLHAYISDVVMSDNRVRGVLIQTKSGPRAILAGVTVDATGDADVAFHAGAPHVRGRETDGKMRPITLLFRLGNVDIPRVVRFVKDNPQDFLGDPGRNVIDPDRRLLRIFGYFSQVQAARERGELDPECHYIRLEVVFVDRRMVTVNTTRVYEVDGTDPFDLTRATEDSRRQMHQLISFLRRHAPGFEDAFLIDSAPSLGVRETRRIVGEYVLTEEDISANTPFRDSIARMQMRHIPGYDVHSPDAREGAPEDMVNRSAVMPVTGFNFPYRSLVPQRIDGLLVAGRCVSVTQEADRWTRNQPPCILTGQAAGTAAAIAIRSRVQPRSVDIELLQASLRAQGVDIGEITDHQKEDRKENR